MSVGVVANELTMIEPYNLACTKTLQKRLLYLLSCHWLVAMWRHKAHTGSEDGTASVALYRATLKHKVVIINAFAVEDALVV